MRKRNYPWTRTKIRSLFFFMTRSKEARRPIASQSNWDLCYRKCRRFGFKKWFVTDILRSLFNIGKPGIQRKKRLQGKGRYSVYQMYMCVLRHRLNRAKGMLKVILSDSQGKSCVSTTGAGSCWGPPRVRSSGWSLWWGVMGRMDPLVQEFGVW